MQLLKRNGIKPSKDIENYCLFVSGWFPSPIITSFARIKSILITLIANFAEPLTVCLALSLPFAFNAHNNLAGRCFVPTLQTRTLKNRIIFSQPQVRVIFPQPQGILHSIFHNSAKTKQGENNVYSWEGSRTWNYP